MPSDNAVHSDLLVYWTGAKDIEQQCGTAEWFKEEHSSTRNEERLMRAYLDRLANILKYGLWMTDQAPPKISRDYELPTAPCTCFTELKLSQSRTHAARYGRLGLAFKRPFLFARGGRPVAYYAVKDGIWTEKDTFLHACASD